MSRHSELHFTLTQLDGGKQRGLCPVLLLQVIIYCLLFYSHLIFTLKPLS